MKKTLGFLALILLVSINLQAYPQQQNESKKISLKKIGEVSSTPRVPSDYELSCLYEDGELYFSFPEGAMSMSVVVRNEESGATNQAIIYSETQGVALPGSATTYYIGCCTDHGIAFTGYLNF